MVALTAYSNLETETKRMKAELEQLKRKRTPKSDQKQNKLLKLQKPRDKGQRIAKAEAKQHYCYAHGYQKSHKSAECKVLNADKKRFTHAMRNSLGPNSPAGGSTRVNGQEVTPTAAPRTITANSACAMDCDDHHESYREQDMYDADVDDETTAFLSQI